MMRRPRPECEQGSTLVEMLLAAAMGLLALGMVGGGAIPALRALEDLTYTDHRRVEVETAGEIVARVLRAARPDAMRPAVSGDDRTLIVALGAGRTGSIVLDAGTLTLGVDGDPSGSLGFPVGILLEGLDMEGSAFALLGDDGEEALSTGPAALVVISLSDGGTTFVRAVAPRLRTHLDGAVPW